MNIKNKISNTDAMKIAINESKYNERSDYKDGGPFGAAILKDGKLISYAHNTVIKSKDATAHAEVNAIRKACKKLNTHNLEGCVLYTSAEPCPMCLSAIIWANIKEVYYSNTRKDAADIGFRDDMIYEYLNGQKKNIINIIRIENEEAIKIFRNFKELKDKKMY